MSGLSYRMLECPDQAVVAQVDDKGSLSSGSLTGSSSLLVTSQEAFGVNQTLILALKVSGAWPPPENAAFNCVSSLVYTVIDVLHPLARLMLRATATRAVALP